MSQPLYTAIVESLPATVPFVGPETQERARGRPFRARIGANESAFGPSPHAVAAIAAAAATGWQYGDPECHALKTALAAQHGVAPGNIVVGEGIDALLGYAVRLLAGPDRTVVTSEGAYPTFNYHVAGHGAGLVKVPYRDDHEDPERLLEAARAHRATLIYLANPDNPMGTRHGADMIGAMIAELPPHAVLCLDEAYGEFAPASALPPIDVTHPRVLRLRTFSKAYGMAGLRIGYAVAHADLARAFDKIRNHFGVSRVAQAGALAALEDGPHLAAVLARTAAAKARIAAIAAENGLCALPSGTNFVTIDIGGDGALARALVAELTAADVFVRMPFAAPQDRCIRVTAGLDADLDVFASALPSALAGAYQSFRRPVAAAAGE